MKKTEKGKISDVRLRLKRIFELQGDLFILEITCSPLRRRSNEREVRIDADKIGSRVCGLQGSSRDDVEIMIFGKFLVPWLEAIGWEVGKRAVGVNFGVKWMFGVFRDLLGGKFVAKKTF